MAVATLYLVASVSGNVSTPGAALGAPDGNYTTDFNSATNWTHRWTLDTVAGGPWLTSGTHTVTLRMRKGSNSGNPAVTSVTLYQAEASLGTLTLSSGSTTISSTTGQDLVYSFSGSLLNGLEQVGIEVVTLSAGGGPSVRNAVAMDAATWSATFDSLPAVVGSVSATETGLDVADVQGSFGPTPLYGSVSATETGLDVANIQGTLVPLVVTGSIAVTEAGQDTASGSGTVSQPPRVGSIAITEPGFDTAAAAGAVRVSGATSALESGNDSSVATGAVRVSGTIYAVEEGVDTVVSTGGRGNSQLAALLATSSPLLCVLVEVSVRSGGTETIRYLSNRGYVTDAGQTPPNTVYEPCIVGGVTVKESLPLDGSASMSWGDIEVANNDGVRDSWLNDVWSGRQVKVLAGDVTWPRTQFVEVFSGIMEDIAARSADIVNLLIRDKGQQLNEAMSEALVGGTGTNKDEYRPLCFGECHNVTPVLIDPVNLVYQVHNGAIEDVIEVRDNGVPVSIAKNLAAGTFALTASPVGTITASVQGAKPAGSYLTRAGDIITHIVTTYGKSPLLTTDIDTIQVAAFNAEHPQAVGVYLDGRANVLRTCQDLAASVGAQVVLGAGGKLQIQKVSLPATGTPAQVTPADMVKSSLSVSDTPKIQPAFRLSYCKNWTVQTGLQTGLPAEHSDMYGREWLVVQAKDQAAADEWKLSTSPEEIETLLISRTQAEAEAARRLALWGVRRKVLRYEGYGPALLRELGSPVTVTHQRFDLGAGKTGQVVGREVDWLLQRVTFEVLV